MILTSKLSTLLLTVEGSGPDSHGTSSASLHSSLTNEHPTQQINNMQTKGTGKLPECNARICSSG